MSDEWFLLNINRPPTYQAIFKVSYEFRSLLNPIILHLKTLIGLLRYIHG